MHEGMNMYYIAMISTFIEQSVPYLVLMVKSQKVGYERWVRRISSTDSRRAFDRYENGSRVHTLPPTPIARCHKLHSEIPPTHPIAPR